MPSSSLVGGFTVGQFTSGLILSYSLSHTVALSLGGRLGFPVLKDGPEMYTGDLYLSDTAGARAITPTSSVPIAVNSSMPITYQVLGGVAIALYGDNDQQTPFFNSKWKPTLFVDLNYLYLPFSNVQYTLQDGRPYSALVSRPPGSFDLRVTSVNLGFTFDLPSSQPDKSTKPRCCCDSTHKDEHGGQK